MRQEVVMLKTSSAILATVLCAGVAHASVPVGTLPPTRTKGDIAWISGGVGMSQAKAFEQAERHYPLTLEFVLKPDRKNARAEFAAAIPTIITDSHGKQVFSATSQGPFMLLKLPKGRYTVVAEHRGRKLERHVFVGSGHHRVVFEWIIAANMAA
jgi:hypothetical protein